MKTFCKYCKEEIAKGACAFHPESWSALKYVEKASYPSEIAGYLGGHDCTKAGRLNGEHEPEDAFEQLMRHETRMVPP